MAQERGVVEAGIELFQRELLGHGGIDGQEVAHRTPLVGRPQGRPLDDRVGVLARQAGPLDERGEHPAAGMEPEAAFDVLAHPLRPNDEALDEPGHAHEQVVEQDCRVRQDDPLGRAVADVALVPQWLVLQRNLRVATQEPGETGDALGQDRIALVRHRRAALLAAPERFLELADLGVLEVADLGREAFERAAHDGHHREQSRMPVALDDLGRNRIRLQPEVGEHLRLDVGSEMAVRSHGARDLAGRDLRECRGQPSATSGDLERPARDLEPECRRLGVDRVGPAHHDRVRLRAGARDERGEEAVRVAQEDLAGRPELEGEPSVHDVAARKPEMKKATLRSHPLRDLRHEGDHVVVGGPLDLGDALDVDARTRLDRGEGLGRNDAPRGLGPRDADLDPEHVLEAGRVRPDGTHLRQGVAADHAGAPATAGKPSPMSRRRRAPGIAM